MYTTALSFPLSPYGSLGYVEENNQQFLIDTPRHQTWRIDVLTQIVKLLRLNDNWDTYGAKALCFSAGSAMYSVLNVLMRDETPVPTIAPTSDGTLQAEWHTRQIDLEIEVVSASLIDVYFKDHVADLSDIDEQLNVDLTKLEQCIRLLTSRTAA